ncbi:MAG: lactoylglutathione lyase [Planctomycetota bacterium]|jgi:lactoylglutathione lyase
MKLITLATLALTALCISPSSQDAKLTFSKASLDFGIVVSDIEASAKFYSEVLGFREAQGFSVGADFCRDAGLTDGKPLDIRVFVLGEGADGTKVKLMQVEGVKPKESDNAFVESQFGMSYMTIFVSDMTQSLAVLKKAGVATLAKSPVPIGEGEAAPQLTLVRDPDGNLIELIGPLL